MYKGLLLSSLVLATHLLAGVEVEPNGSFTKAQEIFNYDTVFATINRNSSDYDYYKFRADGHAFNLSFQTSEENMEYYVYVYNQQQKQIEYFYVKKGETGFNITLGVNPGTVYVKVYASNYTGSDGGYNITVSGLGQNEILQKYEIQPNGDFTTANELLEGVYYQGYISKNMSDYDYYKFNNYNNSMHLVFETEEQNIDHYIYVYDQQHNQVKYFNLPKGDMRLDESFGIAQGTVYVKVYASNYTDSFGAYKIAVNPGSNPSPVPPDPSPVPRCDYSMIYSGDMVQDWLGVGCMSKVKSGSFAKNYQFTLNSSASVQFALNSDSLDTYLSVYDIYGNLIASDDDGGMGTNSQLSLSLSAGTYVAEVSSYYENTTGSFTLQYNSDINITPIPDPTSFFGAIAYDNYTGYWATGWRYSDQQSAEQTTLQSCGSSGCEIVANVSGNECAALAVDSYTGEYEVVYDTTRANAEDTALFVCSIFHDSCQIETSVCADGR